MMRLYLLGFNGAPRGITSCLDKCKCLRANSERGKDYANCMAVHAEQNAIISASRQEMIGSTLYLTGYLCDNRLNQISYVENPSPCSLCKRMIINSGIERVVVRVSKENYMQFNPISWGEIDIIGGY